ncbi:D-aminoacyl-tRNA deacylase [Reinekea marinisedimentorum]|uniref:D-aminoacyl-tRNA deacylase n=1 Tax=Reinekea marinisedimentorum TaxID=230495 RepID=A0A4R3IDL8_9GAMM|nr:D-aminoacyl-tRNA deacylase [Reinekea marinisedimentorum]TCS43837.1 D-tyrosyl-tRNA(Tyr) deacylase [Reinekea marinisedimentorum]
MKALIQRVKQARVEVDNQLVSSINAGMLVLVGIDAHDTDATVTALAERLLKYRLFADEQGKMNLNVQQSNGEILLVSQFTLSAETRKGLRPGFSTAATPSEGERLFNRVVEHVHHRHKFTKTGQFGADMQVFLQNDGPVTFLLEN